MTPFLTPDPKPGTQDPWLLPQKKSWPAQLCGHQHYWPMWVGERERESNWPLFWVMWTHQQRNCLQFAPAQWERTHPFSCAPKNSAALPQKPPQMGPGAQQSHCQKKESKRKFKAKKSLLHSSKPKGRSRNQFSLALPLCWESLLLLWPQSIKLFGLGNQWWELAPKMGYNQCHLHP